MPKPYEIFFQLTAKSCRIRIELQTFFGNGRICRKIGISQTVYPGKKIVSNGNQFSQVFCTVTDLSGGDVRNAVLVRSGIVPKHPVGVLELMDPLFPFGRQRQYLGIGHPIPP